jgi:hypothetical protein
MKGGQSGVEDALQESDGSKYTSKDYGNGHKFKQL